MPPMTEAAEQPSAQSYVQPAIEIQHVSRHYAMGKNRSARWTMFR